MPEAVKVLLVEDDQDFAFLIRKMIKKDESLIFVGHASDKFSAVEMARRLKPDIVVMDLNLSGSKMDGIEASKEIRLGTNAKILLLTSYEEPEVIISASKKAFASGYVFKSQCQTLTDTIYKTATANTPQEHLIKELLLRELTPAERGVFTSILRGNRNTPSSIKTIANQKTSIFRKLGLKNTNDVIRIFGNW